MGVGMSGEQLPTHSILDFKSVINQGGKAHLSPLRSLDFAALNNASFTLVPT
jgi:hypothetical protein